MVFKPDRFEQILQRMIARVVARTELSDLTDSSAVKHLLAAAAREDDEQNFQMGNLQLIFDLDTAEGPDLDDRAKDLPGSGVTRLGAVQATGNLIFSRQGTSGTTLINVGTRVKTASGVIVETTAQGQITAASVEQISGHGVGRDSGLVPAIAIDAGLAGNVAGDSLKRFVSKPPGLNEVTNLSAFTGGLDEESDDDFRSRIREYINTLSRCTIEALEFIALGVSVGGKMVKSAKAVEDLVTRGEVILYIDDGSGTAEASTSTSTENVTAGLAGPPADSAVGGEEFLQLDNYPTKNATAVPLTSSVFGSLTENTDYVVNPPNGMIKFQGANYPAGLTAAEVITTGTYWYYTGLIAEVQKVIDGDPNDRENYPGWRAGGVRVTVLAPQVVQQVVTASIIVLSGYDKPTVIALAEAAVDQYVNNLRIGDDVVANEIVERIMAIAGVYDVTVTTPTSNTPMLDSQLARIISSNINIT